MVIAVDFDGTLIENRVYPYASKPIIENIEYAIKFCKDFGIDLDAVNENIDIEDKIRDFGYNSRKVYADIYLDDKAMSG